MDRTIKALYYFWIDKNLPEIKRRTRDLHGHLGIKPRKIVVVTGFRRVGKTYLVYDLIKDILKEVSKEEAIYINFNDERIPRRTEFLSRLLPVIREISRKEITYLFLDEVQEMPNWSKWLRRLIDNEEMEIFVTGSSSKVSSREIPTELRGRCLEVEMFPLSFSEFLDFKGLSLNRKDLEYREKDLAVLRNYLLEYLKYGGMPEVVQADERFKIEILQQYYRTVVSQDIIERHKVHNEEALKTMMRLLINSTQYSISKLHNTMKSMGMEVGKSTLIKYLGHVKDSYFLQPVMIHSTKVKDSLQYPRKVYFIDNGFITALSTRFDRDQGRSYENCVAVELMRRGMRERMFYWRNERGWEVDFCIRSPTRVDRLIQVCYDLDDPYTKEREVRALIKASSELECDDLAIITGDVEKVEEHRGKKIRFIPLWKFLLEEK